MNLLEVLQVFCAFSEDLLLSSHLFNDIISICEKFDRLRAIGLCFVGIGQVRFPCELFYWLVSDQDMELDVASFRSRGGTCGWHCYRDMWHLPL